jgi:hypothetical protein
MTTSELLTILIPSLGGVTVFAYYLSHLVDHGSSKLGKEEIARIAKKRLILPASRSAFSFFLYASDHFFGKRLFSLRALSRSLALSGLWIFLVLAICWYSFPNYKSWLGDELSRNLILRNSLPLIFAGVAIDFLSLCLTRYIIRLSIGKKAAHPFFSLLVDFLLSVLLFYVGFSLAKIAVLPGSTALGPIDSLRIWLTPSVLPSQFQLLQPLTADMLIPVKEGVFDIKGGLLTELVYAFPEAILFFSSMLSSVWLWLYVGGYILLYVAVRLDRVSQWYIARLDLDHGPGTALGLAIVVIYLILCFAFVMVNLLINLLTNFI